MTRLSDLPPEIRVKIYKKLDMDSLLKFGESGTKYIPEILRGLTQTECKELWFEAARSGYCRWLLIMATKELTNTKDEWGLTALHWAARYGNFDCLKALIQAGADLNAKDNEDWTALYWATVNGKLDCLKALIQAGVDLDVQTEYGSTALHKAAQNGKLDCLKALIQAGADLDVQNKDGLTALHWATLQGKLGCLKALIQAGADLNAKDKYGQTALDFAETNEIKKILKNAE